MKFKEFIVKNKVKVIIVLVFILLLLFLLGLGLLGGGKDINYIPL